MRSSHPRRNREGPGRLGTDKALHTIYCNFLLCLGCPGYTLALAPPLAHSESRRESTVLQKVPGGQPYEPGCAESSSFARFSPDVSGSVSGDQGAENVERPWMRPAAILARAAQTGTR